MAKPKILREMKPAEIRREPPSLSALKPHPWLGRKAVLEYQKTVKSEGVFDVYVSSAAEQELRHHAQREAAKQLEVLGFLLGQVFSWKGCSYTLVRGTGTTKLKSTSSKVRFDPVEYPRLFHSLDDSGYDYIIVGWYHSHPGHTCFMSRVDLETQRSIFNERYHVALVIDPLNQDIRTYRLEGRECVETRFAVYQASKYDGETPKGQRMRKLKVKPVVPLETRQ